LLRRRAFSFVLIRLSWDLMFATKKPFVLVGRMCGRRARAQTDGTG
jgi:3-deoxy-D-arabino-heptulosonate 7-phosphate (DAHP) synthase class II